MCVIQVMCGCVEVCRCDQRLERSRIEISTLVLELTVCFSVRDFAKELEVV